MARPLRMATTALARLLKCCRKKVSVPVLVFALLLVMVITIDLQVRTVCMHVEGGGESPGAKWPVLVVPGAEHTAASGPQDSLQNAAVARVQEVLEEEVEESERGPGGSPDEGQRAQPPAEVPVQPAEPGVPEGEDPGAGEVEALTQILEMRRTQARGGVIGTRTCLDLAALNNTRGTCVDTTCPHHIHSSAQTPVRQLLGPRFRLTPEQLRMVEALGEGVAPRKYLFVTAASSNHYNESQALVYNMRRFIFPKLPQDSYTFLYYDLGLKPVERRRVEKNCNCTVMPINLRDFPSHARHLMCYAWKPFIIKALLPKSEVLVYMDASVRFSDMNMDDFFSRARRWGAQFLASMDSIPNHTVQSTFDFYQAPPCLFWPFPELLAGFSVFHNEPFMTRVVLDSWVACAFSKECMCPVDPHAFRICQRNERRVGGCHRFDLSSLTLQMALLYGDKFGHLVLQVKNRPRIVRDDRMGFFTD